MTKELERKADAISLSDDCQHRKSTSAFPADHLSTLWSTNNKDYFAAKMNIGHATALPHLDLDYKLSRLNDRDRRTPDRSTNIASENRDHAPMISENDSPAQRTAFLARSENRRPFNLKKIWKDDDRVIAIGDQHLNVDIKAHTAAHMGDYQNAGACAIGMELFPQSSQPDLDTYTSIKNDSTVSDREKQQARSRVESWLVAAQATPSEDTPESMKKVQPAFEGTMKIIDAAIDNGVKPVAVEPNISMQFSGDGGYSLIHQGLERLNKESIGNLNVYTNPDANSDQRLMARHELRAKLGSWEHVDQFLRTMDQAISAGFDFKGLKFPLGPEESDADFVSRLHDNRNKTWADVASKYLQASPGARMIMFAGMQHFEYGHREGPTRVSANERLREHRIGTTVLQFTGGEFANKEVSDRELAERSRNYAARNGLAPGTVAPDSDRKAGLRYTKPAKDARVHELEFVFKVRAEKVRSGDFIVHLPQTP